MVGCKDKGKGMGGGGGAKRKKRLPRLLECEVAERI